MTYQKYLADNPKLTVPDPSICAANLGGRLFGGGIEDAERERCHHCGELLHPYPEPTYWMEHPLPGCTVIDGLKFCDQWGKEACAEAYLAKHPTMTDPTGEKVKRPRAAPVKKPPKRAKKPAKVVDWSAVRNGATALLAADLPSDKAGLLSFAAAQVSACNKGVLASNWVAVKNASDLYEAAVWKLNGGTFLGCSAGDDPKAGGNVIEQHCRAAPGVEPLWGQTGEFLVTVSGVRVLVEFSSSFGALSEGSFHFGAVDLDGPFISETGFLSSYLDTQGGLTVGEAAAAAIADMLRRHRRYITAEHRNWLAAKPLAPWLASLQEPPRRSRDAAVDAAQDTGPLPEGFVFVDAVCLTEHQAFMVRKWAAAAASKLAAAKKQERAGRKAATRASRAVPVSTPHLPPAVAPQTGASDPADLRKGQRCKIIATPHQALLKNIGKIVVIDKVNQGAESVWAHDDVPIKYRKSRKGGQVVASDPKNIQTCYGTDCLKII